ncbi:hypothetical protein TNCV_3265431 [Trichonephila clavipes]|nr:hypothetical protein TNCV_3265431 [Trichonephila clavipes]
MKLRTELLFLSPVLVQGWSFLFPTFGPPAENAFCKFWTSLNPSCPPDPFDSTFQSRILPSGITLLIYEPLLPHSRFSLDPLNFPGRDLLDLSLDLVLHIVSQDDCPN